MERELAQQFAACDRKFADLFNAMTELTVRLPDQEKAKRIRRIMAECLCDLDDELYRDLRRSHPDLLGVPDLRELRRIGWSQWDPLGLKQQDSPRDEYDRYLVHAADMLMTGESVAGVASYLTGIVTREMGLTTDVQLSERTAHALAAYVATLKR